jgi:hypothetical protein
MRFARAYQRRHKKNRLILNLCPGETVTVRKKSEILSMLDERGTFEGLPFMPEMRKYCGKRFKVLNRFNTIMVEGAGVRCIKNTVSLEGVTCNGEAHSGCKRTCLALWKEAWLRRVPSHSDTRQLSNHIHLSTTNSNKVQSGIVSCQSVNLIRATSSRHPLVWRIEQFRLDMRCRTFKPLNYMRTLLGSLGSKVRSIVAGKNQAAIHGELRRTPTSSLNLQPGELIEVKSKEEISATLDAKGRNRGLGFSAEMLKYSGKRYRVLRRVDTAINEETSRLRQINNTVILEGVTCDGTAHGGCKRNCYCLWREIWLKRVK